MKNVLVILAGSLLATTVKAQMPSPVDSLKISKDVSLDEVVITATKVGKETPVAYSDISKQELSSRNNGQGIPFLISQSPSVIMTSDAGTGITRCRNLYERSRGFWRYGRHADRETVLKALRRIFRISRFFRYAEAYGKRRYRITLRSFRFRRPLLQYP